MFNISDFIMETLKGMAGNYPEFQVREYALNWYAKKAITEEHLAELENILNPPIPENVENVDNIVDNMEVM